MSGEWRTGQLMSDEELQELFDKIPQPKPVINRNVLCWQNLLASFVLWGMIFGLGYLFWWKAGQ